GWRGQRRFKAGGMARGMPVKQGLDASEQPPRLVRPHEAAADHLLDVLEILLFAAFDLGEGLRVEIVVVGGEPSPPADERTPVLPARELGNEVRRRDDLDVDGEGLLEGGDLTEEGIRVGDDEYVRVDRLSAPAFENSARAAGQVDPDLVLGPLAERPQQLDDPTGVR